jgi:hypothetical protein
LTITPKEVPEVLTKSNYVPELMWASRVGASGPGAVSFPGITLPAASSVTGPCASVARAVVAHAVPRVRGEVSLVALPQQKDVVPTQLGQTNIHNYMTRAYAAGEGASGPPPQREPV